MNKFSHDDFFQENQQFCLEIIQHLDLVPKLIFTDTIITEAITQNAPETIVTNLENMCCLCNMMPERKGCIFALEVYYTSILTNMAHMIVKQKLLTAEHLAKISSLIYAIKQWQHIQDYVTLTPWFVNKLMSIYREQGNEILLNPYVGKAIEIIYEEMNNKNLTTNYVAQKVGISVNYLITLFKYDMSETPALFIKRSRIKMAALNMRRPKIPLSVIAEKYGFKSQSQFSKSFKDIYGVTPLKYKASVQAKYPNI